jgi:UDP-N-acetylmuramyl pentapeptide phosphotransferase/UDP-N-acetylglucosamine-1-phosphate transferase
LHWPHRSLLTMWLVVDGSTPCRACRATFDTTGPQKVHRRSVPRVGGLGVVLGLWAGALVLRLQEPQSGDTAFLLLLSGLPAFAIGIAEDLTKQSARGAGCFSRQRRPVSRPGGWAPDRRTDIPGLDTVVSYSLGALLLTVFAVSGVANAINLIDGFNGLASMCVLLMLLGLLGVSLAVGDALIMALAMAGLGSVLGFFVWNYPSGKVFLGDGGAYFLGFFVAELVLLLLGAKPGCLAHLSAAAGDLSGLRDAVLDVPAARAQGPADRLA